jgi:molybdenum cofactor cytidylyltransferase
LIGALLLAAGSGRRFGRDKLLAPLGDGTPMAVAAASTLLATLAHVVAIVRPGADVLARALRDCGAEVAICPRADEGMGSSLAWGVAVTVEWSGWAVALADMPFVRPVTVRGVVATVARGAAVAAPCFQGRRGHPVCFGATYRDALLALTGDRGGRDLLRPARDGVHLFHCDDPGVVLDIDTPADLLSRAAAPWNPIAEPRSELRTASLRPKRFA